MIIKSYDKNVKSEIDENWSWSWQIFKNIEEIFKNIVETCKGMCKIDTALC